MDRRLFLRLGLMAGAGGVFSACEKQDETLPLLPGALPQRIRLAPHGAWGSSKASGVMGIMQSRRYLEQEFEKDNVRVEWQPMDGGGIGINEAIANGLVDVSSFGAFPQIIGQARGIRTRILASQGFHYSYFAVRSGYPARSPADLKGATLAVGFGAYTHHSTAMLLKEHGIALTDVKLLNMDAKDATAALAAGRIDGYLGGPTLFALEDQGIVRIIYVTRGRQTYASAFGGLFVTEDFARRYPDAVRRIVKSYIRTVHWVSLPENRQAYVDYNASISTTPVAYLQRDLDGRDLKDAFNPVIDAHFVERLRDTVDFCVKNRIIREPIDVDRWVDRSTIAGVLAELGLENYWPRLDVPDKTRAALDTQAVFDRGDA